MSFPTNDPPNIDTLNQALRLIEQAQYMCQSVPSAPPMQSSAPQMMNYPIMAYQPPPPPPPYSLKHNRSERYETDEKSETDKRRRVPKLIRLRVFKNKKDFKGHKHIIKHACQYYNEQNKINEEVDAYSVIMMNDMRDMLIEFKQAVDHNKPASEYIVISGHTITQVGHHKNDVLHGTHFTYDIEHDEECSVVNGGYEQYFDSLYYNNYNEPKGDVLCHRYLTSSNTEIINFKLRTKHNKVTNHGLYLEYKSMHIIKVGMYKYGKKVGVWRYYGDSNKQCTHCKKMSVFCNFNMGQLYIGPYINNL